MIIFILNYIILFPETEEMSLCSQQTRVTQIYTSSSNHLIVFFLKVKANEAKVILHYKGEMDKTVPVIVLNIVIV